MDHLLETLLTDHAKISTELSAARALMDRSTRHAQRLEFRAAELAVRLEAIEARLESRRKLLGMSGPPDRHAG